MFFFFLFYRLCSPDRADAPNGWEAPAPATQPALPLRLYVPELEEIRVSPVVARKGLLNVLEHGGSGWKKRWVVSNIIDYINVWSALNFLHFFFF